MTYPPPPPPPPGVITVQVHEPEPADARDDKVKRLAFQLQVNVWLATDGRLEKVELVRGSGNEEADAAVLDALRRIGKVDQAPPPSLDFPARVLIQGRRPGA